MMEEAIIKFITNACLSFSNIKCIDSVYLLKKKDKYFIQYVLNTNTIYAEDIGPLIENYTNIRENIPEKIDYGFCTLDVVNSIKEPKILIYPQESKKVKTR